MKRRAALGLCLATLASPALAAAEERLPEIGPAPDFALTSQDGARVALHDLRGKVVAVTFVYTSCPDICPVLTELMAGVQDALGADFGTRIAFVSITVDPARDTPEVLKAYAQGVGANPAGWSFLTGEVAAVRAVARRYGVVVLDAPGGGIDHTLLTSLVDRRGVLRVQYLGSRFDPEEFRRDLLALANEP